MSIKIEINDTVITVDSVAVATELLNSLNTNTNNNFMNNVSFNTQPFTNDFGLMSLNYLSPIGSLDYSINNYMNFVKTTNNYRYHLIITKVNDVETVLIYDMKKDKYYIKENPGKVKEITKSVYDDLALKYRNNQHLIEYDACDDYRINIDNDIRKQNVLNKYNNNNTNDDTKINRYHIIKVKMTGVINHITEYILYIHDKKEDKYYSMTSDNCYMDIKRSVYNKAISDCIKYKCNIEEYDTDNIDKLTDEAIKRYHIIIIAGQNERLVYIDDRKNNKYYIKKIYEKLEEIDEQTYKDSIYNYRNNNDVISEYDIDNIDHFKGDENEDN